ncbi:protein Wnt-8b-like [Lampetra planeri]
MSHAVMSVTLAKVVRVCSLAVLTWACGAPAWPINNLLTSGSKVQPSVVQSVTAGARLGLHECAAQFAWERWDCGRAAGGGGGGGGGDGGGRLSVQHAATRAATREAAFVHAVSAAGVVHTLARNCSAGDFASECGCDDSKNGERGGEGWVWGGCSDNVLYGQRVAQQLADSVEAAELDPRAAVNRHNFEAGHAAVRATMGHVCKCHGVSGSCTLQTCWQQLSELSRVGAHLKERYRRAARLDLLRAANSASAVVATHGAAGAAGAAGGPREAGGGNGARAGPAASHRSPHAAAVAAAAQDALRLLEPDGLAFLEDSPDYCRRNESLGAPGTLGRECRRGSGGADGADGAGADDSCERLCTACGLRVLERRVRVTSPCNCSFTWCCRVSCQQCTSVHSKFRCGRPEAAGRAPGKKRLRARQQQQQQRGRNRKPNAASQAVAKTS